MKNDFGPARIAICTTVLCKDTRRVEILSPTSSFHQLILICAFLNAAVMTTLPSFLFDNYQRYKEDTNRVATWLAETAQKHGHPLKDQIPTPRPPGRLKGKYRK